ncbi:DUF2199 domain-containing protein [Exiguobacterium sp. s189]|uniref:DUF2199 domain-containing protein n=1 Tax=Exiguobacterium sp. s189 TaxID=2751263 RepID=UPI001BEC037D|nr:DUF2199 domain-containing protein [Exiguobacterium sp. s189]
MRYPFKRKHNKNCTCSKCGRSTESEGGFGSRMPTVLNGMTTREMKKRVVLTDDVCVLDEAHFFIYGCLEIPIVGEEDPFIWNVWVSLSADNFFKVIDLWDEPARVDLDPMFGWLSMELPIYPNTINLKTNVHMRGVGLRPLIELEPTNHPLAIEQRNGITRSRVDDIFRLVERDE